MKRSYFRSITIYQSSKLNIYPLQKYICILVFLCTDLLLRYLQPVLSLYQFFHSNLAYPWMLCLLNLDTLQSQIPLKQNISSEIFGSCKKRSGVFSSSNSNLRATTVLVIQSFWVSSLKALLAIFKSKWTDVGSTASL